MFLPLDGPSKQGKLSSVGTSTPVEVKVDASAFEERKVVTLQSDGNFYIYFADGSTTPTASNLSDDGFLIYADAIYSVEASNSQPLYVLAETGTVNIRIAERA